MGELEGSQVINGPWKCLIKFLINVKGVKTIILVNMILLEVYKL